MPNGSDPPSSTARPTCLARELVPDEVLLFRYSALTFNGYRIHYDRRFATEVQGYPGLVVHAPLIATLLADLLRRNLPAADVSDFLVPRACGRCSTASRSCVCGRPEPDGKTVTLWAQDASGAWPSKRRPCWLEL